MLAKGQLRTRSAPDRQNEDSALADDARGLYLVSDGIGRHQGGVVAGRLVVEAVSSALLGPRPHNVQAWLNDAFQHAARALHDAKPGSAMGATLTLLLIAETRYHVAHIGDSRAYLWRDGRLRQITNDHTVAWEQFLMGAIAKDELRAHPNQKHLTRSLSALKPFALPEFHEGGLKSGDQFLLCTDGLTKALSDTQLVDMDVDRLMAASLASPDDTTAIVVRACDMMARDGGR
jgi:protein phosphatase